MTMKSRAASWLAGMMCAGLAGCSPQGDMGGTTALQANASLPPPAPIVANSPTAPTASVYRISPGDMLEITVFNVQNLSRTVEVDGSGNILLPLINAVPASGRTVRELEAEVARRLGEKYLQNPQVSVFVKEAVGQRITVDGAVRRPGVFQAKGQMTLLRVLAESGGFSDTADYAGVMVFRNTQQGRQVARFDANAIRAGQLADPPIYGGDTIVVDESGGKLAWKQFREALPVAGMFRVF